MIILEENHVKSKKIGNIAFIYDEELNGYVLSPAYDLTRIENKFEHEMTANGNYRKVAGREI